MGFFKELMETIGSVADRALKSYEEYNQNYVRNHTVYDIGVGFNGEIFVPHEVNARFQPKLQKYFEFVEFDQICWRGDNDCLLFMQFRVGAPLSSTVSVRVLQQRAQQVGEVVLMEYMREHRNFTKVDNLVSSCLKGNVLSIIYARTPDGVDKILQSRRPKV